MPSRLLQECFRKICPRSFVKVLYLTAMTLMVACFIVEGILIHLVIVPYHIESEFQPTKCSFNLSKELSLVKCENKCSKDRSEFPCHQIYVTYYDKVMRQLKHAHLYDYHSTYTHYRKLKCATSPCYKREEDNHLWVIEFERQLQMKPAFSCFVSDVHPDEALLYKLHSRTLFMNCIAWPLGLFLASLLVIIFFYYVDRCHVWDDDKTVIA